MEPLQSPIKASQSAGIRKYSSLSRPWEDVASLNRTELDGPMWFEYGHWGEAGHCAVSHNSIIISGHVTISDIIH